MSSDFETYEQDFGTLTADITNKIGRIPKLSGGRCYCVIISFPNYPSHRSPQLTASVVSIGLCYTGLAAVKPVDH